MSLWCEVEGAKCPPLPDSRVVRSTGEDPVFLTQTAFAVGKEIKGLSLVHPEGNGREGAKAMAPSTRSEADGG